MIFLYNLFLVVYKLGIYAVSWHNPKARLWIKGRKNIIGEIRKKIPVDTGNLVWMHCASLGEFEQGRPLLEAIRKFYPTKKILLTFFSPSGYEVRKNYEGADYIFYLPADSASNAKAFLDAITPSLAIFVKYEFWYYYLRELGKREIPTLLVSAIFRDDQLFFKDYGGFWRKMLGSFKHFFVQNQESADLLAGIGLKNVSVSGDTRFDRVTEIAGRNEPIAPIEKFCGGHQVIVAGSTWPEDEEELDHFANTRTDIKFIIAPHEIYEDHLKRMEKLFRSTIRYSMYKENIDAEIKANVLIIDNIGMLASLYRYADITYVGGGFGGDGIHNILEAVVYAKPVLFGPTYDKFKEAVDLVENGGAIAIENALELEKELDELLKNPEEINRRGNIAGDYVQSHRGATEKIINYIQANRLLTN